MLTGKKVRGVDITTAELRVGKSAIALHKGMLVLPHDLSWANVKNRFQRQDFVPIGTGNGSGVQPATGTASFRPRIESGFVTIRVSRRGIPVRTRQHTGHRPVKITSTIRSVVIPRTTAQATVDAHLARIAKIATIAGNIFQIESTIAPVKQLVVGVPIHTNAWTTGVRVEGFNHHGTLKKHVVATTVQMVQTQRSLLITNQKLLIVRQFLESQINVLHFGDRGIVEVDLNTPEHIFQNVTLHL